MAFDRMETFQLKQENSEFLERRHYFRRRLLHPMIMGIPKGGTHSIHDTGGGAGPTDLHIANPKKDTSLEFYLVLNFLPKT